MRRCLLFLTIFLAIYVIYWVFFVGPPLYYSLEVTPKILLEIKRHLRMRDKIGGENDKLDELHDLIVLQ